MKLTFIGAALVGVALAGSAQAQTIQQAATGLASAASTITFEGLGSNEDIVNQYAALGVVFGANWHAAQSYYFVQTGGSSTSASNFLPCCVTPLDIFFTQAVSGTAFQYGSNPGPSTFTAFLDGAVVSEFTAYTGGSGFNTTEFWGFDESVSLDRIRIDAVNVNNAWTLDNLEVGAVTATPEPATLMLLGTGFAGVFGVVRRRRAVAARA